MLNWLRDFFKKSESIKPNTVEVKQVEYKEPSVSKLQTNGLDEAIRLEAYYLWEQDGKPEGKADYYWQKASEKVHQSAKELAR